jgi:hypothetical protein
MRDEGRGESQKPEARSQKKRRSQKSKPEARRKIKNKGAVSGFGGVRIFVCEPFSSQIAFQIVMRKRLPNWMAIYALAAATRLGAGST